MILICCKGRWVHALCTGDGYAWCLRCRKRIKVVWPLATELREAA